MAGATFSRYLSFDIISGEDVVMAGATAQSGTSPVGARTAIIYAPVDLRYAIAVNPTAVVAGPLLPAGASIPVAVREGIKIAVLGASGSANITWCR